MCFNMAWKSFSVPDFAFGKYVHYILIAISKEATSDGMSSMVVFNDNIQINKIYVQVKHIVESVH